MTRGATTRRRAIVTIKMAVAIALLVWLARSGRLDLDVLRHARDHWPWLVAAQVVFVVVQWLTAVRWRALLRVAGVYCGAWRTFQLMLSALLFNQVLIGSTGGDVYRVFAFRVDGAERRMAILASVIVDRVVGLYALLLIVPPALIWNRSLIGRDPLLDAAIAATVAGAVALPPAAWAVYRFARRRLAEREPAAVGESRVRRWVQVVGRGVRPYLSEGPLLWRALAISVVAQALIVAFNVMLAFSILGPEVAWVPMLVLIPVALVGMAIPINPPGALGTGEAMYVFLLDLVGIAGGGVISLLQRFTTILWSLPGLSAFFLRAPEATGD